jgi:hypothetical protein
MLSGSIPRVLVKITDRTTSGGTWYLDNPRIFVSTLRGPGY